MDHDCANQDYFELHKKRNLSKEIHESFGTLTYNRFSKLAYLHLKYVNFVNILNRKSLNCGTCTQFNTNPYKERVS